MRNLGCLIFSLMSNSSENDDARLRAGGEVAVQDSDRTVLVDSKSGGETVEESSGEFEQGGREMGQETEVESVDAERKTSNVVSVVGGDVGEIVESEKETDDEIESESALETASSGGERDSSLERHCEESWLFDF